jgi:hypothetical protein
VPATIVRFCSCVRGNPEGRISCPCATTTHGTTADDQPDGNGPIRQYGGDANSSTLEILDKVAGFNETRRIIDNIFHLNLGGAT